MSSRAKFPGAILAAVLTVALLLFGQLSFAEGGGKGDRLPAELDAGRGGYRMGLVPSKPDPRYKLDASGYRATALSSSVDLTGKLPPIGDQGNQGSCVGWATGYYYKTWWEKNEHSGWDLDNPRYRFSPSFVYNQINGGQDAGAMFEDAFPLLEETGDVDIEEFPYDDSDYTTQPTGSETEAARQYRIPGEPKWGYYFKNDVNWGNLGPFDNDIAGVKAALNSGKPVVFGIPVFSDFPGYNGNPDSDFYDYSGYNPDYDYQGGHAVCIAGYDDDAGGGRGGFLMVNSWGSSWNNGGTVYLSYDFAREYVWEAWFMEDKDSSPVISTLDLAAVAPGGNLTINGTNFGCRRRSARVSFAAGGGDAQVVSWTNSRIQVRVPSGARSGNVYVYDWNGERSNGKSVTVDPDAPVPSPQPVPVDLESAWFLAEGATWPGFDEWVLVMNPSSAAADVSVAFLTPAGPASGPRFELHPESRRTIHVNEFVTDRDVSAVVSVHNDVEVCVERAMYVNAADGKWGSHDSIGAMEVSETWYLAEGCTWPGFDEWVLVMNPQTRPVEVQVDFLTSSGTVSGPRMTLGPCTRGTVHVNDFLPNRDVATVVECLTDGCGVVAERSMYVNASGGRRGCHNSLGITEAAEGWGLAEGATWPGFDEWVLVMNPTGSSSYVYTYFLTTEEVVCGPEFSMRPGSRVSLHVNDYVPGRDVSTVVLTGSSEEKVVVERAMYVNRGGRRCAHNAPASAYACTDWYLPEGCTSNGFDEWIMVMNPDTWYWAYVELVFMTPDGPVYGPWCYLPPLSRETFHVNDYVSGDVSAWVRSDCYVVAERSMYVNTGDGKRGAHCSMGILAPLVGAGAHGGSHLRPSTRRVAQPGGGPLEPR